MSPYQQQHIIYFILIQFKFLPIHFGEFFYPMRKKFDSA